MSDNIKIIKGNIFNTKAQTIVNTVNCVGVMGKRDCLSFQTKIPKHVRAVPEILLAASHFCRQTLAI